MYLSVVVVAGKVKKGVSNVCEEYPWLHIARWAFKSSASLLSMPGAICGVDMIEFKKEVVIRGLY
jgi:hypothetical protein